MARGDSVSVFAEGTFEEQVRELVEYMTRAKPEAESTALKEQFSGLLETKEGQRSFGEDEERRRNVVSQLMQAMSSLGEGQDREVEGFANLLFAHLTGVYASDSAEFQECISHLANVIRKQSPAIQIPVKFRVLANLFNAISRTSPARLVVCKALVSLAADSEEMDMLQLSPSDVDRWLSEWNCSPDEKSDFLKTVADAFSKVGQIETAYTFSIQYVKSLGPSNVATFAGLDLIATALRTPTVFDFDSLLKLENIQALSNQKLFELLKVFHEQGLSDFLSWKGNNQATLNEYQLDGDQLLQKFRLSILSELGFSKIGQCLSYADIAKALQIEQTEVEKWAIDAIRVGLLHGKLSQTTQTLHIVRAAPRGFGAQQWIALEQRLLAWKEGIAGIQNVLASTRQSLDAAPAGSGAAQMQLA